MKYQGIARIRINGAEYPTGDDSTLDPAVLLVRPSKGLVCMVIKKRQRKLRWNVKCLTVLILTFLP